MTKINDRLENAVENAVDKFWDTVRASFPEIKTGDLSVDSSNNFNVACDIIVRHWYQNNKIGLHTPSATATALKQLQAEFPDLNWKDTSWGNDATDSISCEYQGKELRVWMQNVEAEFTDFCFNEDRDGKEFYFKDFQDVVAFIRKEYTKPPRKLISWNVFDAKDIKGIEKKSGYKVGNEITIAENAVAVLLSEKKNFYVFLDNKGKFYTDACNQDAYGTLEECVKLIDDNCEDVE